VREEFYSVYNQQVKLVEEQARLSRELEECGEDMDRMQVRVCFGDRGEGQRRRSGHG
jgi:hypothetical protein